MKIKAFSGKLHGMNKLSIGNHLIADFTTENNLTDVEGYLNSVKAILKEKDISYLGETTHVFDSKGFTASIILAESHINVHTWPEYGIVNLDIFLCNFKSDNYQKLLQIYEDIEKYFSPDTINNQIIKR